MNSVNVRNAPLNCLIACLVFLAFFSASSFFCSKDFYWGESPLITSRSFLLGGAHPPGYSGLMHLIRLIEWAPFGDIALRANLAGSLFIAFLAIVLNRIFKKQFEFALPIRACAIALLLFSEPMLSANTAAEVYIAKLLLEAIILAFLLKSDRTSSENCLIAFLFGLSLFHHLTTVLLLPGWLFLFFKANRRALKTLPVMIAFFAIGSSIILFFPIRESVRPPIVWGEANNLRGFFNLITAHEEASGSIIEGIKSPGEMLGRVSQALQSLWLAYGLPGVLLMLWGYCRMWKKSSEYQIFGSISLLFLLVSISVYKSNEIQSFFLSALVISAVWFCEGVESASIYLTDKCTSNESRRSFAFWAVSLALLLPLHPRLQKQTSSEVQLPRRIATDLANRMKSDDMAISRQSDFCFSCWYLSDVENRIDAPMLFQHLLSFKWYYREMMKAHSNFLDADLLRMPFEDSWQWNRLVTAKLIFSNLTKGDIWISDPEILRDAEIAGLAKYQLRQSSYFGQISIASEERVQSSLENQIAPGCLDPLSLMALKRWEQTKSVFAKLSATQEALLRKGQAAQ
jgi:hypothetical protein